MAFEKCIEIIRDAQKSNTSAFSVNCIDYNTIKGVILAAEETSTPVLVQLYPGHVSQWKVTDFEGFAGFTKRLASQVNVPVGLHLDHCYTYEEIRRAADAGFTSVMYDGSELPLEENAEKTRVIAEEMHARGIAVEGEIGHVGLAAEDAGSDLDLYTKPEAAKQFYETSGVDMLAIAIGNAHGFYKGIPHLDIDRLDAIHAATPGLALVLHGGSGIPDDQLEVAFSRGINKFNYGTNYLWAYYKAMECFIKEHEKDAYTDVLDLSVPAQEALIAHMKERLGLCHFA